MLAELGDPELWHFQLVRHARLQSQMVDAELLEPLHVSAVSVRL
jgi:hypothetical protein